MKNFNKNDFIISLSIYEVKSLNHIIETYKKMFNIN